MNEKIEVLSLGCSIFREPEFLETLIGFMRKDPRIALTNEAYKRICVSSYPNNKELDECLSELNRNIKGIVIEDTLNLDDSFKRFNFVIPTIGPTFEVGIDAFGLHGNERSMAEQVRLALQKPYNVRGVCPVCVGRALHINDWQDVTKRIRRDYDPNISAVSPEQVLEFAGRN